MRFDMKQVNKHERLISVAAISVIIFAFSSSLIMVEWFFKQPHLNAEPPAVEPHHAVERPAEHPSSDVPPALPPSTGVILL